MFAHYRPFLFIFVFLLLGIYLGSVFFYYSKPLVVIIGCLLALLMVLLIIGFVNHKNKFFAYIFDARKKILTILISFTVGISTFAVMHNTYKPEYEFNEETTYSVVGVVKNNYAYNDYGGGKGSIVLMVKDVKVSDGISDVNLTKNIYVTISVENFDQTSALAQITPNDEIVLVGKLIKTPVFGENTVYEYAYKSNFEYKMKVKQDAVSVFNRNEIGLDSVRRLIYNTLYNNMSPKYASLAYSVLIGDRAGLDDEIENNLKVTGVAHIVAVSGLHVGFLVVLMIGFCRLCRIKKGWLQLILVSFVLIFYCLLCNLTPSVTRATIMAICLLSAKAFKKQSDSLSSVSLAGIIILCMHPLYVFDISFQLSFSAVFAIILLVPLFKKVYAKYNKKKLLYGTCETVNLSLSAQIGTTPYIMKTFGYVSTFSLIVNVIIVPFFGIVYMLLFVLTLLSCIIPFVGHALIVPEFCFIGIDWVTKLVASIPYSTLPVKTLLPIELFLWALTLFIISDKCILRKSIKHKLVPISLGITIVGLILCLVM